MSIYSLCKDEMLVFKCLKNVVWDYNISFSFLINPKSAGSQSTESNVSLVSHLADSCSNRVKFPSRIVQMKQLIDKKNF